MFLLLVFFIVFSPVLMADFRPPGQDVFVQKNGCHPSGIKQHINMLVDHRLNIRLREDQLSSLLTTCPHQKITQPLLQMVVNPNNHLEWFLKKQVIQWLRKKHSTCRKEVVQYLWSVVQQGYEDQYVLEDMIWTLSDTLQGDPPNQETVCGEQVIYWLSDFIQEDQRELPMQLVDFRARMILPLFLSIVRLGIRNQNDLAAQELKAIALNHDVNDYFRSVAVESLQSLGVYLQSGAHGLYEVVQEISMRYIGKPHLEMKDEELIRDSRDQRVRQYAYKLLEELVKTSPNHFLKFVFINAEKVHAYQLHWRRALHDLTVPKDNQYAISAMEQLSKDSKVSADYRERAENLLSLIVEDNQTQVEN